jgi:NAD(P)-dependent dehydrogenase (short-subunit alcohol dehydrogenase family)
MTSTIPHDPTRTWLITGCSSGIGRALCERVLEAGERLVATSRNVAALNDLVAGRSDQAIAVQIDISDSTSVDRAVQEALDWSGGLDVVVNNAGYGIVGALEEVEEDEVRRAFETNVLGAYRVTRAVLPHMRERGGGHILNVSSALGLVPKGGYTIYCATKFALEGMTEAFAEEVAPFGIKVTLLEPGSFRTAFRSGGAMYAAPVMEPYRDVLADFRRSLVESDGKQPGDPKRGAEAILAVVNAEKPPIRLPMGRHNVENFRRKLDTMHAELTTWQDLSLSTDFDD